VGFRPHFEFPGTAIFVFYPAPQSVDYPVSEWIPRLSFLTYSDEIKNPYLYTLGVESLFRAQILESLPATGIFNLPFHTNLRGGV
jgi:hypothetical protein